MIKKFWYTVFIIAVGYEVVGQDLEFVRIQSEIDILSARWSDSDKADVDLDGDIDILILSRDETALYINEGMGRFTIAENQPFDPGSDFPSEYGSVNFSDLDGDGDPDLVISGYENKGIYMNDGTGNFDVLNSGLTDFRDSPNDVGDVDGDGDNDIVISGDDSDRIFSFFMNDGSGSFDKRQDNTIEWIREGFIILQDIDNDSDLDLFLSGEAMDGDTILTYVNDGAGNFTFDGRNHFAPVTGADINFADLDNDNDADLIIAGRSIIDMQSVLLTKFFRNDGSGLFTEIENPSVKGFQETSMTLADVDADLDLDLLIAGTTGPSIVDSELYLNDGSGIFTPKEATPFIEVRNGTTDFLDVDGDTDPDIIITGLQKSGMYRNDGSGDFQDYNGSKLLEVTDASLLLEDFNNDQYPDLIISGFTDAANGFSEVLVEIYTGDGSGKFYKDHRATLDGILRGSISSADIDGDGDLDIFMIGQDPRFRLAAFFLINDGSGNFTQNSDIMVEGAMFSRSKFGDVDGDSDPDLVIAGVGSGGNICKLYLNDGTGQFTESGNEFVGVKYPGLAFGDIEGDGDLDLMVTGASSTDNIIDSPEHLSAILYKNDGIGNYTASDNSVFTATAGPANFFDFDLDGDQDVLLTGFDGTTAISKLYTNDGSGVFEANTSFPGVINGQVKIAHFNADEWADILMVGSTSTKIFLGAGDGQFRQAETNGLEWVTFAGADVADINKDGRTDFAMTGSPDLLQNMAPISVVYLNGTCFIDNSIGLDELTLSATAADAVSYQWYNCDTNSPIEGATNQSFTVSASGSYKVEIADGECSIFSRCMEITILGSREPGFTDVEIYPNPAVDRLMMKGESVNSFRYTIMDLSGHILKHDLQGSNMRPVDVSSLKPGLYIIDIYIGLNKNQFKFIKN